MRKLFILITSFFLLSFSALSADAAVESMERYKRAGAVFAESLGDAYPVLEQKGWTITGTPQVVSTPYGKGMSFDGTGDYINQQYPFSPFVSDSVSFAFWMKGTRTGSTYHRIISIADTNGSGDIFIGNDGAQTDGRLRVRWDDGSSSTAESYSDILAFDGEWHHVVVIADKTDNVMRVYMDGVVSATTDSIAGIGAINSWAGVYIGALDNGSEEYDGDLTNFMIFPRVLTADEVTDLYNQTTFNYLDNLVFYTDMSDVDPVDFVSGSRLTGTSITTSDMVTGQHGYARALDLDGSNDYVASTTIDNSTFNFGQNGEWSVFQWASKDNATTEALFYHGAGGLGDVDSYWSFRTLGDNLAFKMSDGVQSPLLTDTGSDVDDGEFHFLGASISRATSNVVVDFYVDGEFTTQQSTTDLTGDIDNESGISIGGSDPTVASNTWAGKIGGTFVFDEKITQIQQRDLYESTKQSIKSESRDVSTEGHWPLNSHVEDVSGNGNDGTNNSVTFVDGPFGKAIADFNGSSSNVNVGSDYTFGATENKTITFWVNSDAAGQSNPGLVDKRGTGSSGTVQGFAIFQLAASDGVNVTHDDGANNVTNLTSTVSLVDSNNFIAWVVDRDNGMDYLYVNGDIEDSEDISSLGSMSNSKDMRIGARDNSGVAGSFFNGKIWNVHIYDKALTAEEIEQRHVLERNEVPLPVTEQPYTVIYDITDSNLQGQWLVNRFTDLKDHSNSNNDLTNSGVIVGGEWAEFDGSSSYADFGTDLDFDNDEGSYSVAATFKTTDSGTAARLQVPIFADSSGGTVTIGLGVQTGKIQLEYFDGSWNSLTGTTTVSDGVAHRVVCTLTSGGVATIYVDGVQEATTSGFVVTSGDFSSLGAFSAVRATMSLKDVQYFDKALSLEEVQEDYANRVQDDDLLFHFSGWRDVSRYARSLTNTATVFGQRWANFDGADSVLDLGSTDFIGTGDITVTGWINPSSFGEGTAGQILNNGKFVFGIVDSNDILRLISDGSTSAASATNSIVLNQWTHVAATRTSSGVTNLYINGSLNGTADQDSGTPTAGTTNVFIGNNSAGNRTFDGKIADLKVINRVLTASEINDYYLDTRGAY